ncbi:purple acid phosphatase 3-like [Ziziphus jujuba]|uniref:Purple acid phosphatase n=1 Tax=Ziziphus jujuba TaxID=326968 RepID=A0A6P3YZR0_ZIZJJ|nr:purple acid phosphatase 3-like [Ziziphus jujuba]
MAISSQITIFLCCAFIASLSFCSVASVPELQRLKYQLSKVDDHGSLLSFLVVGDWGRRGLYNQSKVALQMGLVGEKLDIDFVISTGDNFYEDGLTGVDDPAFKESFSNIYTAPSLQKQWFSVLGNHDYRGDVQAQLSPILRKLDKRWLCLRSFIVTAEMVDFIFVDTTPFVNEYFTNPKNHTYDWRGVLPRENYLQNLLKGFESALRQSQAKWKIVVGHHTIKSAGHHGITKELEEQLLPILKDNHVDLYVNGHDHCLEHISDTESQIQFLTSGGGSKAWRGDIKWWKPEELKLYYDGQGFMSVQLNEVEANIVFYDVFGHVLHKWKLSKELDSDV